MEKYIIIPAEELTGRERRAYPNGKKILNPNWVEPGYEFTESDRKLIAAGGEQCDGQHGPVVVFSVEGFGDRIVWDCKLQEFLSTGCAMDREIGKLRKRIGF